jgi:hypothetical protein
MDTSQSTSPIRTITTSFDDQQAERPIGVTITQKTISIDSTGQNNILLVQLDIRNTTSSTLAGLVAGGYFDWDASSDASDRGRVVVDSLNTIVGANNGTPFRFEAMEQHEGYSPTSWVGIVPLSENRFSARRITKQGSEVYPPHMTKRDKWQYINFNRTVNANGDSGVAGDHGQVFGLGPYTIPAGATKRTGFAIVAGTSFQQFIDAARAAQKFWVQRLSNRLSVSLVGVNDPRSPVAPTAFSLDQNYPNPFNPNTLIRFALPKASWVALRIFNILGQEVATLADDIRASGTHQVEWNGRSQSGIGMATGVYFYRLEARAMDGSTTFLSTKKALLLK